MYKLFCLQKLGKFHQAMETPQKEMEYLRCTTKVILRSLLHSDMYNCHAARELVTEILSCDVFEPLLDLFSDPFFLHKVMVIILSDDEVEIIDTNEENENVSPVHEEVETNETTENYQSETVESPETELEALAEVNDNPGPRRNRSHSVMSVEQAMEAMEGTDSISVMMTQDNIPRNESECTNTQNNACAADVSEIEGVTDELNSQDNLVSKPTEESHINNTQLNTQFKPTFFIGSDEPQDSDTGTFSDDSDFFEISLRRPPEGSSLSDCDRLDQTNAGIGAKLDVDDNSHCAIVSLPGETLDISPAQDTQVQAAAASNSYQRKDIYLKRNQAWNPDDDKFYPSPLSSLVTGSQNTAQSGIRCFFFTRTLIVGRPP